MRNFDGAVAVFFELGDGGHDELGDGAGNIISEVGIEKFADIVAQNDVAVDIDAFVVGGEETGNEKTVIIYGSREEIYGTFALGITVFDEGLQVKAVADFFKFDGAVFGNEGAKLDAIGPAEAVVKNNDTIITVRI